MRGLTKAAPKASGLVPTVGRDSPLVVAIFKLISATVAAAATTAFGSTVIVETSLLSTRRLIALSDYLLVATLGGMVSTRAEWAARRGFDLRALLQAANIALFPAAVSSAFRRSYCFMMARPIHSRNGHYQELSSIRTSASYYGVRPLKITLSTFFGSTGGSTL